MRSSNADDLTTPSAVISFRPIEDVDIPLFIDGSNGPMSRSGGKIRRHEKKSNRGVFICQAMRGATGEAADGRRPLLVIDGEEISWDEFGRILSSFEGWQFRLEIKDRSEEV